MVTLHGAVRHGVFLTAGNGCIDAAVTGYLVDGQLPARDGTCEAGPLTAPARARPLTPDSY